MNLARLELYIPKWVEMLPPEHPVKEGLVNAARNLLQNSAEDENWETEGLDMLRGLAFVNKVVPEQNEESAMEGTARIRVDVDDAWYYRMLSEMAGFPIEGEYQLIALIKEMSQLKSEYEKAQEALRSVRSTGYGVITPELSQIQMEDPALIHQGGKYGVKLKTVSPSIHLIKAEVETEISPIVGNQQQAEDLIAFIRDAAGSTEGIWETNIFGKSIREMTEDGIHSKLSQMTQESQQKLQDVMKRIVNESKGGFVCIII